MEYSDTAEEIKHDEIMFWRPTVQKNTKLWNMAIKINEEIIFNSSYSWEKFKKKSFVKLCVYII